MSSSYSSDLLIPYSSFSFVEDALRHRVNKRMVANYGGLGNTIQNDIERIVTNVTDVKEALYYFISTTFRRRGHALRCLAQFATQTSKYYDNRTQLLSDATEVMQELLDDDNVVRQLDVADIRPLRCVPELQTRVQTLLRTRFPHLVPVLDYSDSLVLNAKIQKNIDRYILAQENSLNSTVQFGELGFTNSPPLTHNAILFRGVVQRPKADTVIHREVTSLTYDLSIAIGYAVRAANGNASVLVIRVPPGARVVELTAHHNIHYANDDELVYNGECEIIVGSGKLVPNASVLEQVSLPPCPPPSELSQWNRLNWQYFGYDYVPTPIEDDDVTPAQKKQRTVKGRVHTNHLLRYLKQMQL